MLDVSDSMRKHWSRSSAWIGCLLLDLTVATRVVAYGLTSLLGLRTSEKYVSWLRIQRARGAWWQTPA